MADEFLKLAKKLEPLAEAEGKAAGKEAKAVAEKSTFGKIAEALSYPQKMLSKKAAEVAGLKPAETSEQNFYNLVDAGAQKLGLPQDNPYINAAKAATVAGAEVFADPLDLLPVAKIAKAFPKAKGMIRNTKIADAVEKIAEKVQKLKGKVGTEEQLAELAKQEMLKAKSAKAIPEELNKVMNAAQVETTDLEKAQSVVAAVRNMNPEQLKNLPPAQADTVRKALGIIEESNAAKLTEPALTERTAEALARAEQANVLQRQPAIGINPNEMAKELAKGRLNTARRALKLK